MVDRCRWTITTSRRVSTRSHTWPRRRRPAASCVSCVVPQPVGWIRLYPSAHHRPINNSPRTYARWSHTLSLWHLHGWIFKLENNPEYSLISYFLVVRNRSCIQYNMLCFLNLPPLSKMFLACAGLFNGFYVLYLHTLLFNSMFIYRWQYWFGILLYSYFWLL